MSTRHLRRRVENIEDLIKPSSDGTITLEDLCWSLWHEDKKRCLQLASSGCTSLSFFIPGFERAERLGAEGRDGEKHK
jgi:hypothetical protein